jgi:hypothetical protein
MSYLKKENKDEQEPYPIYIIPADNLNSNLSQKNLGKKKLSKKRAKTVNHSNKFTMFQEFRQEYINYMLLNRFPIKTIVFAIVFFVLTNLTLIFLQFLTFLAYTPLSYLAPGVW